MAVTTIPKLLVHQNMISKIQTHFRAKILIFLHQTKNLILNAFKMFQE